MKKSALLVTDVDPASEEEIHQFVSSTDWSLINESCDAVIP